MSLVCRSCRFQSLPVVCNDRCPPQLQFINMVVYTPVVVPRLSHGPDCSSDHRVFAVAVHVVVDVPVYRLQVPSHPHPCRGAEACSHGADCSSDQEFPKLRDTVIDVPVMQVLLLPQVVHIPAVVFSGLVLLVTIRLALCSLLFRQDQDARHLGRCGPEGPLCGEMFHSCSSRTRS